MGEGSRSSDVTAADIASYAVLLGIDPAREFDLLWIAEEALTVKLPAEWAEHYDEMSGNYYYHNVQSGDVQWESPLESNYKAVVERERKRQQKVFDENASSEFNAYFARYGATPQPEPEPEPHNGERSSPADSNGPNKGRTLGDSTDDESEDDGESENDDEGEDGGANEGDDESDDDGESEDADESESDDGRQPDEESSRERSSAPSATDPSDPDGSAKAAAHILVLRHSWTGASDLSDNDLEDLLAFCVYMGVSPYEGEIDCLDVVAAAMNAPCPSGWSTLASHCLDSTCQILIQQLRGSRAAEREDEDSGRFYYHCQETQEVSWSHPRDAAFRKQIKKIRASRVLPNGPECSASFVMEKDPQNKDEALKQPSHPRSPKTTPNAKAKAKARAKAKKALFSRLDGDSDGRDRNRLQAEEAEAAARAAAVARSAVEAAEQKAAARRAKNQRDNEAQLQREVKRRQEELKQRAREEAQRRRDIMRAREREAAWQRAASAVGGSGPHVESSLPKTPRGRVQRSVVSQRYGVADDDGVRVKAGNGGHEKEEDLERRQEQRLKELRVEMAAKARDAEQIARVQKRVDAEAAGKDIVEMLRTIGQVWPPAAAKVAAAGPLPASTKKAKMQVLRMVHPDKVDVNAPIELKAKAQRIFTTLQSHK